MHPQIHTATVLSLSAHLLFALTGIFGKYLSLKIGPAALTGWVMMLGPIYAFAYTAAQRRAVGWRKVDKRLAAVRALFIVLLTLAAFTAYRSLALAEAISITFTTPIFVTLLSIYVLKEQVGWHRKIAVIIGLVGVLVILRPGFDKELQFAHLLILGSALLMSINLIILRHQLRTDQPAANFLVTSIFTAAIALLFFGYPMSQVEFDSNIFAGLMLAATCGSLAVICNSEAYSRADASYLAPFTYTQLIWTAIGAFLIWGEWPHGYDWLGAAIIAGSGIYIVHRERVKYKRRTPI